MTWQILDLCLSSFGAASDQLYCRTTFVKKPIRCVTELSVDSSCSFFFDGITDRMFFFFLHFAFCILYFVFCALHLVSSVLLCRTRGYELQLSRSLCCFKSCYAVLFSVTCWFVRFLFLLILQPSIHGQMILFDTTVHPYCFLSMNANTITYFELIID